MIGWLTILLIALLALFLALDGVAHLTKYKFGETFSAFIWDLERRRPWVRFIVGFLVAVLFTHLVLHVP